MRKPSKDKEKLSKTEMQILHNLLPEHKGAEQTLNEGIYKQGNITIHVKREYKQNKKLNDILDALIVQGITKSNMRSA
jgi:hypothetical protein